MSDSKSVDRTIESDDIQKLQDSSEEGAVEEEYSELEDREAELDQEAFDETHEVNDQEEERSWLLNTSYDIYDMASGLMSTTTNMATGLVSTASSLIPDMPTVFSFYSNSGDEEKTEMDVATLCIDRSQIEEMDEIERKKHFTNKENEYYNDLISKGVITTSPRSPRDGDNLIDSASELVAKSSVSNDPIDTSTALPTNTTTTTAEIPVVTTSELTQPQAEIVSDSNLLKPGSTVPFYDRKPDEPTESLPKSTCSISEHSQFQLRIGPNYSQNMKKASSPPAMSSLVAVDYFFHTKKMYDIGSHYDFSSILSNTRKEDYRLPSGGYLPRIFIVNCQMPRNTSLVQSFTSMFSEADDSGYSVFLVFLLDPAIIHNPTPAGEMLRQYIMDNLEQKCRKGLTSVTDRWFGRFKVMIRCDELVNMSLPSFITSYNGKPVLIRETLNIYGNDDYFEVDVDTHRFGAISRQGLGYMYPLFEDIVMHVGVCIESRDDSEMPETLMGCATLNRMDMKSASNWLFK